MAKIDIANGLHEVDVSELSDADVARYAQIAAMDDREIAERIHGCTDDERVWLALFCAEFERVHHEIFTIG